MNSEQVSLIATHPFIRRFVVGIIQDIRAESFVREEKYVIHADLVPKVSDRVVQASMGKKIVVVEKPVVMPSVVHIEKPRVVLPAPVVVPVRRPVIKSPTRLSPKRMAPQIQVPKLAPVLHIDPPVASMGVGLTEGYGRVDSLLNDPSVSIIECSGVGKPLMVIRAGQRQVTKISLGDDDIKAILKKISEAVHIPLLEGVFRAVVDGFSINAVISEIVGSKFVIKKQNAYSLLE